MKIVEGRSDSFLVLPDGRKLSPMTFWTLMRLFRFTDHIFKFKFIQKQFEVIEVHVKRKDTSIKEDYLKKKLLEHIGKCLHIGETAFTVFDVQFVEEIPLDKSGKLRSVVSMLKSKYWTDHRLVSHGEFDEELSASNVPSPQDDESPFLEFWWFS